MIAAKIRQEINSHTDQHIKKVIGWLKKRSENEKEGLKDVKEDWFVGKTPLPDMCASDWSKVDWCYLFLLRLF